MRPTTVPRRHGGRNRMTYASYSRSPETRPAFLNSEANVSSVIISVTSAEISLYNVFSAGSASSSMARLIPSLSRRARDTEIRLHEDSARYVLVQEGEGYRHRGALVAIRERVVLCKMEDEMRHLSEQIGK